MSIEAPLSEKLMLAFRRGVEKHFSKAAQAVNSQLITVSPSCLGFMTSHAIITIGVYHGHFPGLCVKLRERRNEETPSVDDSKDIGLINVIAFVDPSAPLPKQPERFWTEESLDSELQKLAHALLHYGKPFLIDSTADWIGLRIWLDAKIKKSLEGMFQKLPSSLKPPKTQQIQ